MPDTPGAVWHPLRGAGFARLYIVYVLCFLGSAIFEASAAWTLAANGAPEALVALTSTAATLPVVLMILPFGALADTGGRLGQLRVAQMLSVLVACAVVVMVWLGATTPVWLPGAVALGGLSVAMRLPALTSLVPETLDPAHLPDGMTLLGIATSVSRFLGPALATVAIWALGTPGPYLLTALFSLGALILLRDLPQSRPDTVLPAERMLGAIRVSVQFATQSPELRRVLIRGGFFFFFGAAAQALAPLAATRSLGGGANSFMAMIGAAGVGAILAGASLPRLRSRLRRTQVARLAALFMATGALCVSLAPSMPLALGGAILHGMGWLAGLATFTSLAQQSLPEWIRARGMALAHAALISGVAIGAAVWGQIASLIGLTPTLWLAVLGGLAMAAVRPWLTLLAPAQPEITPNRYWSEPALAIPVTHDSGPAVLLIEYTIRDGAEAAFLNILRQSRRLRLRTGALSWSLFRDLEDSHRFTEQVIYESWGDRQRQALRTTEADALLRERKMELLVEGHPPRVAHWVAVRL